MRRALWLATACVALTTPQVVMAQTPPVVVKKPDCNFRDGRGNLRPEMVRVYVLHTQHKIYREVDFECKGRLRESDIRAFEASEELKNQVAAAQSVVDKGVAAGTPITLNDKGEASRILVADKATPNTDLGLGWAFLLRESHEDVGLFRKAKSFKAASGAQLGYSSDAEAHNVSWNTKGFVSGVYRWVNPKASTNVDLVAAAFAPWVSFNRLTNSVNSLKSKEVNSLSFGTTGELAFGPTFLGDQYLRLKVGYNTDFDFKPKSWSGTLEWQPVSNELRLSAPIDFGPFSLQIDPILRFQSLRSVAASDDPVFSERDHVWRGGGALVVTVIPKVDEVGDLRQGFLPAWLQPSAFNFIYSHLFDTYSGRESRLYNASLTFPLGLDGHAGVKLSYERGHHEETAKWIDKAMIGLALKW